MTKQEKAKKLIDKISEDKIDDIIELLEIINHSTVEEIYDTYDVNESVKKSLLEVKKIREGKLKGKSVREFLNEIQCYNHSTF